MKEQRSYSLMTSVIFHYCRQYRSNMRIQWYMVAFGHYSCTLEMNKVHHLLVCCYKVMPLARMHFGVYLWFSSAPYSFWLSVFSVGQAVYFFWSCLSQFCRICSFVWSSSPHVQAAHSTIFSLLCMCSFRRLCTVLIITCSDILKSW